MISSNRSVFVTKTFQGACNQRANMKEEEIKKQTHTLKNMAIVISWKENEEMLLGEINTNKKL